jgi:hypothetical protein
MIASWPLSLSRADNVRVRARPLVSPHLAQQLLAGDCDALAALQMTEDVQLQAAEVDTAAVEHEPTRCRVQRGGLVGRELTPDDFAEPAVDRARPEVVHQRPVCVLPDLDRRAWQRSEPEWSEHGQRAIDVRLRDWVVTSATAAPVEDQ